MIAALREHCPWMGALTHGSLVEYLLEEAYEVAETIETGADEAELQGELGDVLLQVVLHARLAEERGTFTFDDVARGPHRQDGPPQPARVPAGRLPAGHASRPRWRRSC